MRISTQRVLTSLLVLLLVLSIGRVQAQATSSQSSSNTPTAKELANAKPHMVQGTVLDENGKPMVGVGVIIVTTLQGVVTDVNGRYQIKATPV